MAAGAGSAARENAAPSTTASAAAACRRHGYAVKSCGVKKRPRVLRRVPLRDITNLIQAISAVTGSGAPLAQQVSPAAATELNAALTASAVLRRAALQNGDGDAAGVVPYAAARYSLLNEFR